MRVTRFLRTVLLMVFAGLIPAVFALELEGNKVQGGLLTGQLAEGEQVRYLDRYLQLDNNKRFIIGLDRDAQANLQLSVVSIDGSVRHYDFVIEPREYKLQHINGVAKRYVTPDPAQLERSRREAQKVAQARQIQRVQNDFFEGFVWPVKGPITGVFGSQRVYNGEPRRPHYGVDVAMPEGTPVVAPASGVITLAEPDLYFSGGTLIIDHGHGLSSTFLHLSKLLVVEGEPVRQGQAVAEIGATGRVTGAHLDWRMNWTGGGSNERIDPQFLVPPMPASDSDVQADKALKN